jgi:hypothetical protein
MRKLVLTVLMAAGAGPAFASPVNFATYIDLGAGGANDGPHSQFSSPTDSWVSVGPNARAEANVDIANGIMRAYNSGTAGGANSSSLIYDTLTFGAGAFEGVFGTSYDLTFSAHFTGIWTGTGADLNGSAAGRFFVFSGNTVVDESVFDGPGSLVDFLFFGPPQLNDSCGAGVASLNGSTPNGAFSYDVSCTVTVTQANPTVRMFLNFPVFMNSASSSWTIDMSHTATFSADFGGRPVTSASGVFPGTAVDAVATPEPATLALLGAGLLVVRKRIKSNVQLFTFQRAK